MFTPHPPRPKMPKEKFGFQKPPAGSLLRDGVTAFSKPSLAGDTQNASAFQLPAVK